MHSNFHVHGHSMQLIHLDDIIHKVISLTRLTSKHLLPTKYAEDNRTDMFLVYSAAQNASALLNNKIIFFGSITNLISFK